MSALSPLRPYRWQLVIGIALLIAASLLAVVIPWLLALIVSAIEIGRGRDVAALALAMIALSLLHGATRAIARARLLGISRRAEHDVRMRVFGHLLHMEPGYFRRRSQGELMSRLTSDVHAVWYMLSAVAMHVPIVAFAFVFTVTAMVLVDARASAWAMLPFPCIVAVGAVFRRRLGKASRGTRVELGKVSARLQEDLAGITVIKTFNLARRRSAQFTEAAQRLMRAGVSEARLWALLWPLFGFLGALATVAILWGGSQAVIRGGLSLGQLVQLSAYVAQLIVPTLMVGWIVSMIQPGIAAWARLEELLHQQPRMIDGPGPPFVPEVLRGDISIRDLAIHIDGKAVIEDVNLEFPAGSITAIVGRVGSGKSMLVDAIARLIEIPRGKVFLDGRDVTDAPLASVRRCIGYARQDAFLFSMTVERNIALGIEHGGDATSAQTIAAAARAAGLERDLPSLPSGYDTIVGERGVMVSGGQRQRVALARALAASPRVLIMDDSTSAVDAETEREILTHLEKMIDGRTTILISHRLAAVTLAHRIVVMDNGRVAAVGTHDELLARDGTYAALYRSQLLEQVNP